MSRAVASLVGGIVLAAHAQGPDWPPLPSQGFITGRAATQADVSAGKAAFVAQVGNTIIGKPLPIAIPQYAYFKDGGKRVPVIIIQAEEAQGQKLVGARRTNGADVVGFLTDFELLGNVRPKSAP